MKRLLTLLIALLLTGCTALVWEVSGEMIDFAAQVVPDYYLLEGAHHGDTSMLILEDKAGGLYFAGCVKEGDDWTVTLSMPLPDVWLELTHTSANFAVLNLYSSTRLPGRNALGDMDCNYAIRLQEDGRWMIEEVQVDDGLLYFSEGRADAEGRTGGTLYGELLFSRDITEVDWLTFPLTLAEAADHMALDDWAVTARNAELFDMPAGDSLALYQPGVPLRLLEQKGSYYRAAVMGGETEGWFRMDELLIGHQQLEAPLTVLPWKELTTGGDVQVLGVWLDGRVHVQSDMFPTGEGFLQEHDFVPEGGPVG